MRYQLPQSTTCQRVENLVDSSVVVEGIRKPDIGVHWGENPMISRASVTHGHYKSQLNVKIKTKKNNQNKTIIIFCVHKTTMNFVYCINTNGL